MDKRHVDRAIEEMQWLLSIPSPSGFTLEISEKLTAHLREMGFETRQSCKGSVLACLCLLYTSLHEKCTGLKNFFFPWQKECTPGFC